MAREARILVVDDDAPLVELFSTVLRAEGHRVRQALTGKQGLESARAEPPDLMLLDVRLPDLSGIEVCRQIKAEPALADVFVIMVSGEAISPAEKTQGLAAGADEYLVKPVALNELLARVRTALRLRDTLAALRTSEEYHRQLIEVLPDGLFVLDLGGRIVTVNSRAVAMMGHAEAGESLRRRVLRLVPPGARGRLQTDMAALLRTGVLRNAEYELARKDGGFLHVELSAVSFMGPQGQPQGFVLVARDITDRKRAEGQIRLLANAFTCAHEMVYITDGQLGIRLVNRAALEAYGYPEEELLGRRADFLHSANNPPGLWERISQKIMQSGWKGELLCRRKDGSEFLAELNTSQMKDSEGRVDGLVCVVRDISEQKRAEKQRIAFAELGQRLNAAATAEQTAEIILEIASELFACDAGCVVLYSQTEDKIIPVLAVNTVDGRRMSVPLSTLSHEPTPLMRLVMQEGPRLTNRGDQLPAGVELLQFGGVASRPACQMDVPIRVNGVVQGLLSIQSCTPGAYSPDDLKLLEILAAHSARTLKRLKVTAALRKRRPGIAISSRTRPKGSSRRHSKAVCSTPIWRWLAFWVMNRPRR